MKTIKTHKKLFSNYLFFSFLFLFLSLFLNIFQYRTYNNIVNDKINSIISIISTSNNEEDYLSILNSKTEDKISFLKKYNYNNDVSYIKELNQEMKRNIILNNLITFLFIILYGIIINRYVRKQDKDINNIINYMQNIVDKNYTLDIKNNDEGQLSKLKNELYKITINLKESAEINKTAKENLSDSIADISHQIKTPLTSISILLGNIMENPGMDENTKKDFINEINKQIDIIKFMSITLLKLARFDAGVIELKKEQIDVKKLLREVKNKLGILSELKKVNIEILDNEPATFCGDYNWEVEALSNIIKNCIEASAENSKVVINYESNSVLTKIIIKDFGKGIAKEDLNHIFERFYKGKNSNKDSFGIGLNLAKTIVENDNGYIYVNSIVNKGSTFTIKYIK